MEIKYNLTASTSHSRQSRGLFRSIRYKIRSTMTSCQRNTGTAPQSVYSTLRVKRTAPTRQEPLLHRTSLDWSYMLPPERTPQKDEYVDTFNSLMGSRMMSRRNTVDWRKHSRVQLPSLEQNQQSRFCMLDPMTVSIQYIDELLTESTLGLKHNSEQAKNLSEELKQLQNKANTIFANIEREVSNKLQHLRNCLVTNEVKQVQQKLMFRKDVSSISQGIGKIKQTFDIQLEKSQKLQERVFNALPYQLVENTNLPIAQQPFSQKLF